MAAPPQIVIRNRLLGLLPPDDYQALAADLEFVDLPRPFTLSEPLEPSEYAYFPESGIGSIVARSPEGQSAEIGIFGRDGVTPVSVLLKSYSDPFSTFMQIGGNGHRIRNTVLMRALDRSDAMKTIFIRYAQAHAVQTAYTALSNAVHQIDERLARWILMCHDRTDGDAIALTHEFLSVMLAVRRPTVTTALHTLEGNRLVYSERGLITVRDRAGLEQFAKDAYGVPEQEYTRLLGPLRKTLLNPPEFIA
ncbi:MAG: Crp/Fnr family transcriptional regulator [Allorhizobium sp.]